MADRMSGIIAKYNNDSKRILTSRDFADYLKARARGLIIGIGPYLRGQGFMVNDKEINDRASLTWHIYDDPNGDVAGATSGKEIIINVGHPMHEGKDLSEKILNITGTVVHEVGHILFTDFPSRELWLKRLQQGQFDLPADMTDPALLAAAGKIRDWMKNPILRQMFIQIALDLENCLEDGYEENEMRAAYPGWVAAALRFIKTGLLHRCPGMDEQLASAPDHPLMAIRNQILLYAKCYTVKDVDPADDATAVLSKAMNVVDEVSHERVPEKRHLAVNKILCVLQPEIEKELQDIADDMPPMDGADGQSDGQSQGSGSEGQGGSGSGSGDSQNGDSNGSDNAPGDANGSQSCSNQGGGAQGSGADSNGVNGQQNQVQGSGTRQSGDQSGNQTGGSGGGQGSGIDKLPDDVLRKVVKDLLDKMQKTDGVCSGSKNPENRTSGGITNTAILRNSGGDPEVPQTPDSADVETELRQIQKAIEDIAKNELAEEIDRQEAADGRREAGLYGLNFVRPGVTEDAKDNYRVIFNDVRAVSRSLRDKILQAFQNRRETTKMRHLVIGKRFDSRALVSGDGRYFQTTRLPTDRPKLRVDILIDQSGSTMGSTIRAEQKAAIAVVDFCVALGVACRVMGYYGNSGKKQVIMYCDPKSRNAKLDKYRLGSPEFRATGSTPTGATLAYAIEGLAKSDEELKLMLVLTDGQSDEGHEVIRSRISTARRKGITVIGMGLGSQERYIKAEFGDDNFVSISDMAALPKNLIRLITKYMPLY